VREVSEGAAQRGQRALAHRARSIARRAVRRRLGRCMEIMLVARSSTGQTASRDMRARRCPHRVKRPPGLIAVRRACRRFRASLTKWTCPKGAGAAPGPSTQIGTSPRKRAVDGSANRKNLSPFSLFRRRPSVGAAQPTGHAQWSEVLSASSDRPTASTVKAEMQLRKRLGNRGSYMVSVAAENGAGGFPRPPPPTPRRTRTDTCRNPTAERLPPA